jgi:hypothetical protein
VHNLQYTIYSAQFTNTVIFSYFTLAHQTLSRHTVSPTRTVRIAGLASWTVVLLGFTVDCEYKLNRQNPDDADNGYHEDLEIDFKFSRLTDRKFFIDCTCLERSNTTLS